MRSYWIRVGLNPMINVLIRKREFRHRDREECQVETRLERCTCTPKNVKDCHQPTEESTDLPIEASKGTWPCCHLGFRLLNLQNCETTNFCCFKPSVCGNFLQWSWETNVPPWHTDTHVFVPSTALCSCCSVAKLCLTLCTPGTAAH